MRLMLAALMLIAVPACAGLEVKTEQDWEADFSRYRTYAWITGVPGLDPSLESQVQTAVDRELPFKRLHKVEVASSPDLYVSVCVSVEEDQVVQPDQWGYDVESAGRYGSTSKALTLPRGTLVVDLVDSGSRKLVWRGQATRAVGRQALEETIRKAVREIFRGYPPSGPKPPEEEVNVVAPPGRGVDK